MTKDLLFPVRDIRQSPQWGEYFKSIGWDINLISNNIQIFTIHTILGSFAKIQRPGPLTQEDITNLDNFANQKKLAFIKIDLRPDQDENILLKNGYKFSRIANSPTVTMMINLDLSRDELWTKLSRSARYAINRSKRDGDTTKFITQPDDEILKKFYDIHRFTAKRGKFPSQPFSHTITRRNLFKDKSYLGLVLNKEEEIMGAKLYLGFNEYVLYIHGGTSHEGYANKSGYLLMWDSILFFKNLGFKMLDLEGLYDKRFPYYWPTWDKFSDFKYRFQGEVVEFPRPMIKYFNPAYRFVNKFGAEF